MPVADLVEVGRLDPGLESYLVGMCFAVLTAILICSHAAIITYSAIRRKNYLHAPRSDQTMKQRFILAAMGIKDIRKENFFYVWEEFQRRLNAENAKATQGVFGKQYGLNPRHVSQIKNGTRDIGDAVARRLELAHNPPLPTGWMDVQHGPGTPKDVVEEKLVEIILTLYRQRPAEALKVINDLGKLGDGEQL
jgi:hypothetical protein